MGFSVSKQVTHNKNVTTMRTYGNAKLVSYDTDKLAETNAELGINHLFTRWQFVDVNNQVDNKALAFMLEHTSNNNGFTYIVDLGSLTAEQFVKQLKELGNSVPFTKFAFTIDELTNGKHKSVHSETRTYSNFSQIYIGESNDETSAKIACKDRLARAVNEDGYEWGDLTTDETSKGETTV